MTSGVYERTPAHREAIRLGQLGKTLSSSHRESMRRAMLDERNPHWHGDRAGKDALHKCVTRRRGRAKDYACVHCGEPAKEWANVSHEYRRDLDDFMPLCFLCHKRYDRKEVI